MPRIAPGHVVEAKQLNVQVVGQLLLLSVDLLQLLQLGLVVVDGLLLGLIHLGVQVVVVCCLDLGHLDQDKAVLAG